MATHLAHERTTTKNKSLDYVKVHFLTGDVKEYACGKGDGNEYDLERMMEREGIDRREIAGYKFEGRKWVYWIRSFGLFTGYTGEYITE